MSRRGAVQRLTRLRRDCDCAPQLKTEDFFFEFVRVEEIWLFLWDKDGICFHNFMVVKECVFKSFFQYCLELFILYNLLNFC